MGIAAHLADHAFGDLDGDGTTDAIAILQVTDGGAGIYYHLTTIFNGKLKQLVYQLHGAEFARRYLAGAHGSAAWTRTAARQTVDL